MTSHLLVTHGLRASYGDAQALYGIDFRIDAGEVVAVIGSNGAGKSTLLKSLTGLVKVDAGMVLFDGLPVGGQPPARIVRQGIAMVPEGRRLFPSLTVQENLQMGGVAGRAGPWSMARLCKMFPILDEKRRQPATSLSGGQQQMVAIGRALMSNPRVLLCDELSLGLAPVVIAEIYRALPEITGEGMSVVIVEQDVSVACRVSTRLYCLQEGRVTLQGPSAALERAQISEAYFGSSSA